MDTQPDPVSIVVIVGSIRRPRLGRVVADWLVDRADTRSDLVVDLIDLADVDLPLHDTPPGGNPASPIASRLAAADGFVVVTPEYNHSFPAALKNAVDWHMSEWARKPVAFVSYGAGSGGIRAVEQLRLVFAEVSAATTRNAVLLTAPWDRLGVDGALDLDAGTEDAAHTMLGELVWWADALRVARTSALASTGR